jgi:hypothetical protein
MPKRVTHRQYDETPDDYDERLSAAAREEAADDRADFVDVNDCHGEGL